MSPKMLPLLIGTMSCLLLTASSSNAFMTTQESAEISELGRYKIGIEPQGKISGGGGFNLAGFFDAGLSEETSARVHAGVGDTDFFAGASFKWVPIPDYENQPAIGGKVSAIVFREGSNNFSTFRIEPIASKRFETEKGLFIPYGAFPIMFTNGNSTNTTSMQVVGGTEYYNPAWGSTSLGAEIGVDAKDSFSYISGYVTFYLDDLKKRGN